MTGTDEGLGDGEGLVEGAGLGVGEGDAKCGFFLSFLVAN